MTLTKKSLKNSRSNSEEEIIFEAITIEETLILARFFAESLRSTDSILLKGLIGSGKTFFAREVIQSMMVKQGIILEEVPSPTFTIVQAYDALLPPV